jgi:hypothetical protein
MARKAAKKKKPRNKALGKTVYFSIQCDQNGVIVGAASPDQDLCGFVANISDIKLKKINGRVAVSSIKFQQCEDFGPCTWKKVGNRWVCI